MRNPSLSIPLEDVAGGSAPLRAELDALNLELRELRSTDHMVRAYAEAWLGFVSGSVAVKLHLDAWKLSTGTSYLGVALAVVSAALWVDVARQLRRRRKLGAQEAGRLERQRELRRRLGLDEAVFPPQPQS